MMGINLDNKHYYSAGNVKKDCCLPVLQIHCHLLAAEEVYSYNILLNP